MVRTIANAAEVYYLANGEYPPDDMVLLDISAFSGCRYIGSGRLNCGNNIRYDYNAGGVNWHDKGLDRVESVVDISEGVYIGYIQYLENSPKYAGERYCVVGGAFPSGHKVCKSMGGTLVPGAAYSYRLP